MELSTITLDELVGNLRTYGMRKIELKKDDSKRNKELILKASEVDGSDEEEENDISLLAREVFEKFK